MGADVWEVAACGRAVDCVCLKVCYSEGEIVGCKIEIRLRISLDFQDYILHGAVT